MTFLNPFVLLGLAAASIPVILHLLNLRKLKTVEFSTLRFLKELQKTKIRRMKIRQLILLALRILIIIFAVMAFARPTVQSSLPLPGAYAKTSAVILIDNSFSMDVSDEFGNRFTQARNAALSIINNLKDGDEAAFIEISNPGIESNKSFSRNFNFLKEEIAKIKVNGTPANLEISLRTAAGILEDAANVNKEIYIITDAQPNVFFRMEADSIKLFDGYTSVYVLPVGNNSKAEIQNYSIDSLAVITRIFQQGKPVEVEANIRNNTDKDAKGLVASLYYNDERVSQRTIDIPAKEIRTLQIAAPPQTNGVIKARVELETDALEADNKRNFGFNIPDKSTIAIIGTPAKTRYVQLALGLGSSIEAPAEVKVFPANDFPAVNLGSYDAVILASGLVRQTDWQRLAEWVRKGGAVMIFADDEVSPQAFDQGISILGLSKTQLQEFSQSQPAGFSSVDRQHPLFEGVFKGTTENKNVVESPRIYKARTIQAGQPIISLSSGAFLSEQRLEDGKVIYCAVAPDMNWSSFPITGLFPTLIYRSVSYLASREEFGANASIGSQMTMSLPKKFAGGGSFKIIDPMKNESYRQAAMLPSGAVLSFDRLEYAGVYTVYSADGKVAKMISVNHDPSESNLNLLKPEQIKTALISDVNPNTKINILEDSQNAAFKIERARLGTELWQLFLILAIITAVVEMFVSKVTKQESGGI